MICEVKSLSAQIPFYPIALTAKLNPFAINTTPETDIAPLPQGTTQPQTFHSRMVGQGDLGQIRQKKEGIGKASW